MDWMRFGQLGQLTGAEMAKWLDCGGEGCVGTFEEMVGGEQKVKVEFKCAMIVVRTGVGWLSGIW